MDQKFQLKPILTDLTLQKIRRRRTQKKMAITPVPMRITISTFVLLSDPDGYMENMCGMRSFPVICAHLHDRTSCNKTHCPSLFLHLIHKSTLTLNPASLCEWTLHFIVSSLTVCLLTTSFQIKSCMQTQFLVNRIRCVKLKYLEVTLFNLRVDQISLHITYDILK